jgi:hypothetical protein
MALNPEDANWLFAYWPALQGHSFAALFRCGPHARYGQMDTPDHVHLGEHISGTSGCADIEQ